MWRYPPPARRRFVSTLSTPDPIRRTGGREIRKIVFDAETIARRVGELGRQITDAYPDGELLALGLLKGSFIFLSDLVRAIERPVQVDFLVASSYGHEKVSSGNVRILYDPAIDLEGKHVLLVEDIIDSGRTLQRLLGLLGERRPLSLGVCALLDKQLAPNLPELRFVGFRAPPAFLVGYGLDHAENYRHLPFIADLDCIDG
jgi:hypoxanthine phosphoribosyltransferase